MGTGLKAREASAWRKYVLSACLCFLAALALALWLIPYSELRPLLDRMAADGSADFLTAERHSTIQAVGGTIGVLLALLSVASALAGDRMRAAWSSGAGGLLRLVRAVGAALRAWARTEDRLRLVVLCLFIGVGVALRASRLLEPIRSDEAYTYINYASKPFIRIISDYSAPNNHVFHTILVHLAARLLGNEPWILRLPAFFFGVGLIPLAYFVARKMYGPDAALLASGLVSTSALMIEYSAYARGYAIVAACFLLLVLLRHRLAGSPDVGAWIAFALVGSVGFWTIPTMLYPYGAVAFWIGLRFLMSGQTRRLSELVLGVGVTALLALALYAPAFAVTGLEGVLANSYVARLPWQEFALGVFPSLSHTWAQWTRGAGEAFSLAALVLLAASVVLQTRLTSDRPPLPWAALGWTIPVLLWQRVVPFPRVWTFLFPIAAGSLAAGLSAALGKAISLSGTGARQAQTVLAAALGVGLAICAATSVPAYDPGDTFRSAEQAAEFLADELDEGDRVVVAVPAISPLEYYLGRLGISTGQLHSPIEDSRRLLVIVNEDNQDLTRVLDAGQVPLELFGEPNLLGRAGSAAIYELLLED